jgi:preprotein translocase subunit SecG
MYIFVTIIHVIVCLFLVVVVLLQSGKAADLAGAFGGMGSQTVFGPRGSATVLSKATTIAAALFMLTSLGLSILATRGGSGTPDILKKAAQPATGQSTPAKSTQPQAPAPSSPKPVEAPSPALPTPTK